MSMRPRARSGAERRIHGRIIKLATASFTLPARKGFAPDAHRFEQSPKVSRIGFTDAGA
jgi:hypothetical protein